MKTRVSLGDMFVAARRIPRALRERWRDRRFRRLLRDTPVMTLSSLGEHEVARFTGRIRPLDQRLLEAPVSGRLCVYYDVAIDALVGGRYAGTINEEQEALPFVVEAEGHRAAVDPANARISAAVDFTSERELGAPRTMTARERDLLVRLRADQHRQLLVSGVRFREAILEADEMVTVVGGGVREPDPDATPDGYRDGGQRTWLRLVGTERHPVLISDDPRSRTG